MKKFWANILPFNGRTEMPAIQYVIKILLAYAFCFYGGQILSICVMIPLQIANGINVLAGESFDPTTTELLTHLCFILTIGLIVLFWKVFLKKKFPEMGVNKRIGHFFIGLFIGAILLGISVAIILLTGAIRYEGLMENINVRLILLFALGFLFQTSAEEFLIRGMVFCGLKKKVPMAVAMIISIVLFILPHLPNMIKGEPLYILTSTLILTFVSLIFTFLLLRFQNIWISCGVHFAWNYFLFSFFGLNVSGHEETGTSVLKLTVPEINIFNGGEYGIEASIITAAVLGVGATVTWLMYRSYAKKENLEMI